jgi:cytochrome bd ubiquinol oxidase subunit II
METLWFCLVAVMLAMYVVFDGFDIGAGIAHLFVARSNAERVQVLRSIGPVWDGNEVWLLAAGGTLYFAFPALYASSFSGFYLPLMVVLWLLMLRGLGIEFRNRIQSPIWMPFWDVTFSLSSALLAIFFGAALGNVVRGVPLNAEGFFFEPLWTDFRLGDHPGILDWYTVLIGLMAFVTLLVHGCLWIVLKTEGELRRRALNGVFMSWWGLTGMTIVTTGVTFGVQPHIPARLQQEPWGYLFPMLAIAGLVGIRWYSQKARELEAFLASCLYLVGMLTSVAFGVYPFVLPSNTDQTLGLTIRNAAASTYGLRIGLVWWIVGILLVSGYFIFIYRRFSGKLKLEEDLH